MTSTMAVSVVHASVVQHQNAFVLLPFHYAPYYRRHYRLYHPAGALDEKRDDVPAVHWPERGMTKIASPRAFDYL